jgi:hypothetical protein
MVISFPFELALQVLFGGEEPSGIFEQHSELLRLGFLKVGEPKGFGEEGSGIKEGSGSSSGYSGVVSGRKLAEHKGGQPTSSSSGVGTVAQLRRRQQIYFGCSQASQTAGRETSTTAGRRELDSGGRADLEGTQHQKSWEQRNKSRAIL